MKVLFVSNELIGSAICHELVRSGHDVKLYIEREGWKNCLDGIIPKTTDWKDELLWVGKAGIIVFDDVGFGHSQDKLREQGYRVVGGSAIGDELELNREHFHKILKEHGVAVLPSYDFDTGQEAIDFVASNEGQWVVKQNTHFGALNYVGEAPDSSDVIAILENYKKNNLSAHVQKKVSGVEIGVARYFNGENWIGPIEINHEHKRMCNDDVGPLTPEMGTVMWFSENEEIPLFSRTLAKLKPYLQEANFRGDFDINCIVNEDGIWPLEATARFGAPSTELQSELHNSPWADFLSALADGKNYDLSYKNGYGVAVSIAVPPYPYVKSAVDSSVFTSERIQLFFDESMSEEDFAHIYFEEISREPSTVPGQKDIYYWSGTNGWTMHITGHGETIEEARNKIYTIIKKIILPKKFYRTDIGTRVQNHDLPLLKKWKLI
jgi:phosphoribosylamine--glycine ligase